VKMVGVLEGPVVNLMNVLTEPELMKTWFPYMSASTKLCEFSPFHGIGFFVQSFNLPFVAPREWLMEYILAMDAEKGTFSVHISSVVDHPSIKGKLPPHNPRHVRAFMVCCGGFCEQISPKGTYFQVYFTADIKMSLPSQILKYISTEVCSKAFSNARKLSLNSSGPGTLFGEKLEEKWHKTLGPIDAAAKDHMKHINLSDGIYSSMGTAKAPEWAHRVGLGYSFPLLDTVASSYKADFGEF